ncbi:uncharacterized protein CcaverHIS019_0106390 [Cutaneotrichosporon cavernicola]|uniref:1,3-beta-glucanosyltransferase n=1 Tax=Cutaneotrichosporon cavernicola TaxID=279322 RepID=A0AA48KYT9_9TREE|nr:uncharacterized protein CcaverHIS019_0106390 [Cutaneotrichosporon cavernicola]BEI87921.1 hypothetical protein CcaverHIS019_0106390 [Cutaneotrichosporon cavernicola]BEI95695.1 hypothetical protein CcaverHIS631_0106440 [Cutaneotrichosporon cavernicola]BEJ03469.1 hypothetical protein CcaverHIS641_0106440 [Cutaneotrichosporon cavernicola]
MRFLRALTVAASLVPLASAAVSKISRSGKYLYDDAGSRFYIKGVAYQPQGELAVESEANEANGGFPEPSSFYDPLSSEANCTRDIPYLKQLNVNAVRVYSVNSSLNHDACMKILDDAGIYVLLDVSLPLNGSIDRASPSWTTNLLDEYIRTIDAFNKYPNVLAYNIGNEVISTPANTYAAPYVKAAARDIKAYLRSISSNALVGYAAVDGEASFRNAVAHYMTCGNDTETIDLYGLNNYQWCGDSSLAESNWNTITQGFSDITVPTYMSEFGCITSPPRLWTEVAALLATPVSDVFSGGIAFSYFPTSDGYGMTTIDGNTVTTNSDFTRLSAQYGNATGPNSPAMSSQQNTAATCPQESASLLATTNLPPTPNPDVCNCLDNSAFSCLVNNATANDPVKVGALINIACDLLAQAGSNVDCTTIGSNGTTGTYGPLAMCSPDIKLSWAFSAYYMLNPVATSCDFSGNATRNEGADAPKTAQDAKIAADNCFAGKSAVVTPTSSPQSTGDSGGGNSPSQSSATATPKSDARATLSLPPTAAIVIGVLGLVAGAVVV